MELKNGKESLAIYFPVFTQNLSEIVILKSRASILDLQFGLISLENMTLVIYAVKHLWTVEERIAVPPHQ